MVSECESLPFVEAAYTAMASPSLMGVRFTMTVYAAYLMVD